MPCTAAGAGKRSAVISMPSSVHSQNIMCCEGLSSFHRGFRRDAPAQLRSHAAAAACCRRSAAAHLPSAPLRLTALPTVIARHSQLIWLLCCTLLCPVARPARRPAHSLRSRRIGGPFDAADTRHSILLPLLLRELAHSSPPSRPPLACSFPACPAPGSCSRPAPERT